MSRFKLIFFLPLLFFCYCSSKEDTSTKATFQEDLKASRDTQVLSNYLELNKYPSDSVLYVLEDKSDFFRLEAVLFLSNEAIKKMNEVERTIEWVNYEVSPHEFRFNWLPVDILKRLDTLDKGLDGHADFYFNASENKESLWLDNMMLIKIKKRKNAIQAH